MKKKTSLILLLLMAILAPIGVFAQEDDILDMSLEELMKIEITG